MICINKKPPIALRGFRFSFGYGLRILHFRIREHFYCFAIYGEKKFGELTLLGDKAFLVKDLDAEERTIERAKINADGSLGPLEKSSLEELEKAIAEMKIPQRVFIKEPVFESLRKIFGKDVEVLVQS